MLNFIDKIRFFIFSLRLKQRQKRKTVMPKWDKIDSILLLSHASSAIEQQHIATCINILKSENKQLTPVCFVPTKHTKAKKWQSIPTVQYLYTDQLDIFQKPQFLPFGKFDLLINLDEISVLPLSYITLYANADFRAGMETAEPYPYDLMISNTKDKLLLFNNIIHYIKSFNK